MPRNTTGGDKNKKKGNKYVNQMINRKLEIPDDKEQFIGICIKNLGSSRFTIQYIDNNEKKECIGIARKNLKKTRQFVAIDKFVIIATRDFEKDKVDIIHVYNETEVATLKRKNIINEYLYNDTKEDNIDFKDLDIISDEEEELNTE